MPRGRIGNGFPDIQAILAALKRSLPKGPPAHALHEPYFPGREWKYVKACLDSGWVSSVGKFVDEFERRLAAFTGVKHAVSTSSGTAALHVALKIAGVESGDEVLMPSLSFVAPANAVVYCGGIPHFVDSEERTLGVDPFKLEAYLGEITVLKADGCFNAKTGRRIKALVVVHTFGHPADLDALCRVAQSRRIELIEDAAESIGSFYKGKHTGNWGALSILSFNGNKTVTTGGGGAILTHDAEKARLARHLTTTAKKPHPWRFDHDAVGFNYRMPNLNAALGCAQLEKLPFFLKRKRSLAARYERAFRGLAGVRFFKEPEFARSNYWLNVILLDRGAASGRDRILAVTREHGFMTRPAWTPLHKLPMFKDCPRMDLSSGGDLEARIINIPSSAFL